MQVVITSYVMIIMYNICVYNSTIYVLYFAGILFRGNGQKVGFAVFNFAGGCVGLVP